MRNTLSFLLLFISATISGAQDFEAVEIKTTQLTESIYVLEGSGGNIGICVGQDGTIMVDDQFAPLTTKIKAAIAKITPQPVQFLINTHWHFDHTGGNENFGREGAIIVSHVNSRERMIKDQFLALPNVKQGAYSNPGLPKVTFQESMSFHFNGETIKVFNVGRAHTDGDAIVHFVESNIIHMGDVFVRYIFPLIDEPHGGNIEGMIETLDKVAELANEDTRIIPGHGQVSKKQDLLDYRGMLTTIRDRVKILIEERKTLEQIIASNPTRGYEGGTFVAKNDFVKIVYDNLTNSK